MATTPQRPHRRVATGVAVALTALALAACGSSAKSSSSSASTAAAVAEQGGGAGFASAGADTAKAGADARAAAPAPATAGATATTVPPVAAGDPTPVDRKVIVTVTLDLEVTDVGASGVKVATIAEGVGGYVFSQQTNLGARPSSSIVLKVPPDKVTSLLTTLGSIGKVVSQTQQAEDVTAQFVDLESRIGAARASVARVQDFLARTTNVGELANLEAELTRRQTELEQLLGQQRVLASRSDMATVTVTLAPVAPVKATGTPSVSRSLHRGVDSLAAVGRALAVLGAFVLPWSPVALIAGVAVARRRRRRARRPAPVLPPPAAPPADAERETVDA